MIKNFKNVLPKMVTTVVVVLISGLTVGYALGSGSNIWLQLAVLVPVVLVALAAIGLELKGKSLAAHIVLLLTAFLGAGRAFILWATSFNFSTFSFEISLSATMILNVIIFVYLALVILSYMLSNDAKIKLESSDVLTAAMIAFLFFFFRDGFSEAVLKIAPPMVALLFGSKLFTIVLLLAGVADVPFRFLNELFNGNILDQPISYYVFTAFAFYLIFGAVKGILAHKNEK